MELAQAVQDQANRKVDIIADTRKMGFITEGGKPTVITGDVRAEITPHAFQQITTHTGIPSAYANRMLTEAPLLLESNVNHWFSNKPSLRMLRTLDEDGTRSIGRAFLSNKYQRLDFDQMLAHVLPELVGESSDLQVLSTDLTDRKMYLKVVFPKMEGEVKKGDIVQYGFELRGSEIGDGALAAIPFFYRLWCLNGATLSKELDDTRMRRAHIGRAQEEGVDYYAADTVKADDAAIMLKLRDTIRAFQDTTRWEAVLSRLRAAADSDATADPIASVARVAELLVLPKPEHNAVLTNFLSGGDHTRWGMANAITAVANTHESYDRAAELEDFGGRILALPETDWTRLAKAA